MSTLRDEIAAALERVDRTQKIIETSNNDNDWNRANEAINALHSPSYGWLRRSLAIIESAERLHAEYKRQKELYGHIDFDFEDEIEALGKLLAEGGDDGDTQ